MVAATVARMEAHRPWPCLFDLEPSDTSHAPRADLVIDNRAHIKASPERVFG